MANVYDYQQDYNIFSLVSIYYICFLRHHINLEYISVHSLLYKSTLPMYGYVHLLPSTANNAQCVVSGYVLLIYGLNVLCHKYGVDPQLPMTYRLTVYDSD